MTLKDMMTADVDAVFTNTDDFGVSITYQSNPARFPTDRWKETTEPFAAIVERSSFDALGDFGATRIETRDYWFSPSKLVLRGKERLPERGDVIIEDGRLYIVVDGPGQRCYGYDEDRRMMFVHTVLRKDAP